MQDSLARAIQELGPNPQQVERFKDQYIHFIGQLPQQLSLDTEALRTTINTALQAGLICPDATQGGLVPHMNANVEVVLLVAREGGLLIEQR